MNPYDLQKRFYNFATAKTPWYKIVNQMEGPHQIHIFNVIGGSGVSAEDFVGELDELKGPVELRLNSEGGEVFAAKTIYNALSRRPEVTVIVDGVAASAASFIAMSASPGRLFMSKIATMMIHDGHAMAYGSASDLLSLVAVLDKESDTIASIYADRSGKPKEYFRDKMRTETWYNAEQAMDDGLCDGIYDARSGKILNVVRDAASVPWVSERQTRHEPMTGRHSHDHSAGDAADHDDGQHAHYHTHAGDADHFNHAHDDSNSDHHPEVNDLSDVVLADTFPEAQFYNRTFTTEERKERAKDGRALKDGSYPIDDCQDAMNAREAYGRAPEGKRAAVAAHIKKRESTLKCKHDPFKPGSDNTTDFVITDEDAATFAAMIRL